MARFCLTYIEIIKRGNIYKNCYQKLHGLWMGRKVTNMQHNALFGYYGRTDKTVLLVFLVFFKNKKGGL